MAKGVTGPYGSPGASCEALAAHAVDKIHRVSDAYREFTYSAGGAARIQRIGTDLLELLLDLGLPHRGGAADRRFDLLDLENVGLTLRLPGPRWTAMRWWPRALRECMVSSQTSYRLTLKAACPAHADPHRCGCGVHPEVLTGSDPTSVHRTADGFTLRLTVNSADHVFGPPFTTLIERILPMEHHRLPRALAGDIGFMTTTGLADCRLASAFLVREGRELGVGVRPARGLILATPFPGWHSWVEFRTAAGWIAADPFLLNSFARWGLVDRGEWPAARSPRGFLCRWRGDQPLVTQRDVPVRPALALSREPGEQARA